MDCRFQAYHVGYDNGYEEGYRRGYAEALEMVTEMDVAEDTDFIATPWGLVVSLV